jgi:hypothetical protein
MRLDRQWRQAKQEGGGNILEDGIFRITDMCTAQVWAAAAATTTVLAVMATIVAAAATASSTGSTQCSGSSSATTRPQCYGGGLKSATTYEMLQVWEARAHCLKLPIKTGSLGNEL